jgi:parallel beta-helix repeat protein
MSGNTNSGLDLRFNCTGNMIANNTIEHNAVAGITLMESSGGNTIIGNEIYNNSRYGLQIQSLSDGNIVAFNSISNSQTGIFLESVENHIYSNRIIENAIQVDDRGGNIWNREYPLGGNLWSDYTGQDEMKGSGQDMPGQDGFGDEPYAVGPSSSDRYPIIGGQIKQISLLSQDIDPSELRVGDSTDIKVSLQSRYPLMQVVARAYQNSEQAQGYCRLVMADGLYQGSFSTALLQPGSYDIVLEAKDQRGNELQESLGLVKVKARGSYAS